MKVGTDGVLLGAWAPVEGVRRVLDVGTGTGLIALMLAQRAPDAQITGIDIDAAAVEQAAANAAASPWAGRIDIRLQDAVTLQPDAGGGYDLIVSNPPYFIEKVACPDTARQAARHTDSLDFGRLTAAIQRLLRPEGRFSVVLPASAMGDFVSVAFRAGLSMERLTWVHTKAVLPPKRVLMTFARQVERKQTDRLVIEQAPGVFSEGYVALTRDFYLKF